MLIKTSIALGVLFALAASEAAQEKPDFSGDWILNREASTLSPLASAMQSAVLRIEHHDPTFRYKARFVSPNGPLDYEYELKSDGREVGSIQQGLTTIAILRWEGQALVASWRIQRPDGEMRISFRHELLDSGRRLKATEQIRGGLNEQDNVWIFDRR